MDSAFNLTQGIPRAETFLCGFPQTLTWCRIQPPPLMKNAESEGGGRVHQRQYGESVRGRRFKWQKNNILIFLSYPWKAAKGTEVLAAE